MPENTQTYANHVRWHTPYHFVLIPLLVLHLIWSVVKIVLHPDLDSVDQFIVAICLLLIMLLIRVNPLKTQDRVIRLEEQLRYHKVLPPDLAARASKLPARFIVALRFAPDEELAGLVQQALDGKFAKPADAKLAIKNWRGDYLRV